jgi:hypothetical protein
MALSLRKSGSRPSASSHSNSSNFFYSLHVKGEALAMANKGDEKPGGSRRSVPSVKSGNVWTLETRKHVLSSSRAAI